MLQRIMFTFLLLLICSTSAIADISVFIYHRFGEDRYPSTNISVEVFAGHLAYLDAEGFQVLPLSTIARMLREGVEIPPKSVGLCIDDAFTSFATNALPLLQQYGFSATLFVNTDAVGTAGYLDWAQLREVMSKGVEIGNHTANHAYLVEMEDGESPRQWQQRISADIERSKQALKKHLDINPEIFAYTYGEYSPALIEVIKGAGFKSAFAQQSGIIYPDSNIWALPRFPMGGPYASIKSFITKLKMKALDVIEVEPVDPIIREQNPPLLRLTLADERMTRWQFNCFAQGGNSCSVEPDSEHKGAILVKAEKPLEGRRNKYTLTVLGPDGHWQWFSHLWINAKRPVPGRID